MKKKKCPICNKAIMKCPECDYEGDEAANIPWREFVFDESNAEAFKIILSRVIEINRYDLFMKLTNEEQIMKGVIQREVDTNESVPIDVGAVIDAPRAAKIITLCSILSYFHEKKMGPDCKKIRDTEIKIRLERLRHFVGHIIVNEKRYSEANMNVAQDIDTKALEGVVKGIKRFISEGVSAYYDGEQGTKLDVLGALISTEEGRDILHITNEYRTRINKEPIDHVKLGGPSSNVYRG